MERDPSDAELREWWNDKGRPPVTVEDHQAHMDEVVEWLKATTVDLWATGRRAPYDLFDVGGRLVEAVAGDVAPAISAGAVIPEYLADRIAEAACAVKPEPQVVESAVAYARNAAYGPNMEKVYGDRYEDDPPYDGTDKQGGWWWSASADQPPPTDPAWVEKYPDAVDGPPEGLFEGVYIDGLTGYYVRQEVPLSTTTGDIDRETFVGVHLDGEGVARVYEPAPEPQLLSWIDRRPSQ